MAGILFIISAPSGAGKTSLIEKVLAENSNFIFSISYTTRAPRGNEKNGREYFFVSEKEFKLMLDNNEFLEYAVVHGNYYGTGKNFVIENLKKGYNVILDIDIQGAKIVKENFKNLQYNVVTIFILPPSYNDLKSRLLKRGTDSIETIEKRLKNALMELENCLFYDYLVVNKNFDEAYNNLISIFKSCMLTREYMEEIVNNIIKDFRKYIKL